MKRIQIIITLVIIVAFAIIALQKKHHTTNESPDHKTELANTEKVDSTDIKKFWHLYNYATDFRIDGLNKQAAKWYEKALKINPLHQDGLYYLGSVYFKMKQYDKARECWNKLKIINPGSSRAFSQLGNLYGCYTNAAWFDAAKASDFYEKANNLNKEETGPLLNLSKIALLSGNLKQSNTYLTEVLKTNDNSPSAFFLQGYFNWRKGNIKAASQQIRHARNAVRNTKYAHLEGATKNGNSPLAQENFECDPVSEFIADILAQGFKVNDEITNIIYQQFDQKLNNILKRQQSS